MPVTFVPPVQPSPGTSIDQEVSLNRASFGDGYTQASPRGLRHIRRRVSLRWDTLTLDQARAIDGFLTAQGGYKPFLYTVRGESAPRQWTCESWSVTDGAPATARAELVESFWV